MRSGHRSTARTSKLMENRFERRGNRSYYNGQRG
jgi:hypothetical protein